MNNDWNPFLKDVKAPTLDDLEQLICEDCGNMVFDRYYKMYHLKEEKDNLPKLYNIPIYVCGNCSKILDTGKKKKEDTPKIIGGEDK